MKYTLYWVFDNTKSAVGRKSHLDSVFVLFVTDNNLNAMMARKLRIYCVLVFVFLIPQWAVSQVVGLPYLAQGEGHWGNLNGDAYPDLLLTGLDSLDKPHVYLLQNASGAQFISLSHSLQPTRGTQSTWLDVDGDGDTDLLYGGEVAPATFRLQLFINNAGTLALSPHAFSGLAYGKLFPGDFDLDGDIDCLAAGYSEHHGLVAYWLENDAGAWTERENSSLPKLWDGQGEAGDADGDGDLDLVILGLDSIGAGSLTVLENLGGWQFQERPLPSQVLKPGAASWADIDMDGDLDLAICGGEPSPVTRIYRNQGWQFSDAAILLDTTQLGQLHFRDYDLDGYPDLAISGLSGQTPHTTVYKNIGGVTFQSSQPGFPLDGLYESSLEWADFNQDGYPDFVATGLGPSHRPRSYLFQYQPGVTARFAR